MGSLGILGAGSGEFATNSGSVLVDFATGLPSLVMMFGQLIASGIAENITASVQ